MLIGYFCQNPAVRPSATSAQCHQRRDMTPCAAIGMPTNSAQLHARTTRSTTSGTRIVRDRR